MIPAEPYVYVAIVVVLTVTLSYGMKRYYDQKIITYDELTDEEQQLIDVFNDETKIPQKTVSNQLDWSDAKTSRVTSQLVEKQVIEKQRVDRENYLQIKTQNLE